MFNLCLTIAFGLKFRIVYIPAFILRVWQVCLETICVVVIMLPSSVPIGFMESRLYFNCGCWAAKFYFEVIVVNQCCFSFECMRSDWSKIKNKNKKACRQIYSFLEVKLWQSDWKSWAKIKIFVIKMQHCACKQV